MAALSLPWPHPDRLVSVTWAEATVRQIHSVLIPDAGHVLMLEVPDVVAELMTA